MAEWIEAVLYHLKRIHLNFRGKMYHISGLLPITKSRHFVEVQDVVFIYKIDNAGLKLKKRSFTSALAY